MTEMEAKRQNLTSIAPPLPQDGALKLCPYPYPIVLHNAFHLVASLLCGVSNVGQAHLLSYGMSI